MYRNLCVGLLDRGCEDFARWYALYRAGALFGTRAQSPIDARRVYCAPTEPDSGVACDQRVMFNGCCCARKYPEHLRPVRLKHPESGNTLVFVTSNATRPALTIAALYPSRWRVECFFKRIKQHLRSKKFLGTSENAEKTRIWCAVSTCVPIAIVKKDSLGRSFYEAGPPKNPLRLG